MAEIAAGAQQQATGLEEVNSAVGQMGKMTQQNAAMGEEASAAAASLSDEGEKLSGLIDMFSVGQRTSPGSLRAALRDAAPHAFKTRKTPVRQSASRAASSFRQSPHRRFRSRSHRSQGGLERILKLVPYPGTPNEIKKLRSLLATTLERQWNEWANSSPAS